MSINLDNFLAVPAVWYPGQCDEEWQNETHQLMNRALLNREFLEGRITLSEYCDLLVDQRMDVDSYIEDWAAQLNL